jgi:signal transduction histidine kinase
VQDVQGLYRDTNQIAFINVDLGRNIGEVEKTLSALALLLDGGTGYGARDRDRQVLNTLSLQIGEGSKRIQEGAVQDQLRKLMFDLGGYDSRLSQIGDLSLKLSESQGDASILYQLVAETIRETAELKAVVDAYLLNIKQRIEDRYQTVYYIVIGSMLVAIGLTLFISTLLWLRIIRPIEEISEGIEDFSNDSDPLDVDYQCHDELGKLARNLEGMTRRLTQYHELTNQKLLRSTNALRSILDHSADAFFILSGSLKPVYASPSADRLLTDSKLKDGFSEDLKSQFMFTLKENEAHISKELIDAVRIPVAGEDRWYLVNSFPIDALDVDDDSFAQEGGGRNVAAIFQEVTLLKLSDSLRKNLLATVSHELKTPITSARMSLYLLLEQQLGPLNEDQLELVETARDDVNRQLATIEHLLDLTRVEGNVDSLKYGEFRISALVEESFQAHHDLSASYQVRLNYTPPAEPIWVNADKDELRIVLNNFVVNAIKYSGNGKQVDVTVKSGKKHCRVDVRDNGPGLSEDNVHSIFDAYQRGDDQKAVKGTGLGLKISKDIIDAHKGQIGCSSKLDEGTTFFFEVPLNR